MFTYKDYYELLTSILSKEGNKVYLRHDIDFSTAKALELAKREEKLKLGPATYFIFTCSEWYNPFDSENAENIRRILDLGHKIGLHFDVNILGDSITEITHGIVWHAHFLAEHFDTEITSVTQHMPRRHPTSYEILKALQLADLHDPMLTMRKYKYISDSGMMFMEDPFDIIDNYSYIHLNLHPEWWAEKEGTFEDRLHDLRLDISLDQKVYKRVLGIRDRNEQAKNAYNRSSQMRNDEPSKIL